MNVFRFLLIFSLSIFLLSCSSDDNKLEDNLSLKMLSQTVWQGSYVKYENSNVTYECNVNLFFKSESKVESTETMGEFYNKYIVNYTADNKMLSIEVNSVSPQLSGDWLVTESTRDKIVFQKKPGNNKYRYVMTLSRIYKPEYNLNSNLLKQTVWEGSYTIYDKENGPSTCDVNLFFKTDNEVEFTETGDNYYNEYTVKYTSTGSLLSIEINGESPRLSGDWLIMGMAKDKLTLKKNLGNNKFNVTMTLSKIRLNRY